MNLLNILSLFILLFFQVPDLKKQKEIIKKSDNDSLVVAAYIKIINHFDADQNDSIRFYFKQAMSYIDGKSYRKGEVLLNYTMGRYLGSHGELNESERYLLNALQSISPGREELKEADIHNTLGMVYGKRGDYNLATEEVFKALKLYEKLRDVKGQISTNIKLGVISRLNGDNEYALQYINRAEKLNKKFKSRTLELDILNNKGIIYAVKENYDAALKIFQSVYQKSRGGTPFNEIKANALMNIGLIFKEKKQYAEAIEYLTASNEVAEKNNLPNEKLRSRLNIGLVLNDQQLFKESNEVAIAVLDTAKSEQFSDISTEALDLLQQNYRSLKDYENALKYSDLYHQNVNELKTIQKDKELADLRSTYELKKSQERVKLLDQLNQKGDHEKDLLILVFFIGLLLMSILVLYYYRMKKWNQRISIKREQLMESNEIKNKLFSIIGHDLRSAYNSTLGFLNLLKDGGLDEEEEQMFIDKVIHQSTVALDTLDQLLLWGHIQIKGSKMVPENFDALKEIEKNVGFLEGQFEAKNINVEIHDQTEVWVNADMNQFNFVVRNLLSNAIKFTPDNGAIKISCSDYSKTQNEFCVTDSGIGVGKDQIDEIFSKDSKSTLGTAREKGTGLGLMMCKEFIELNGGKIWVDSKFTEGSRFCFVLDKAK